MLQKKILAKGILCADDCRWPSCRELHRVVPRGEGEHAKSNLLVGGEPSLAQLFSGWVVDGKVFQEVGNNKKGDDLDNLVAHARPAASAEGLEVLGLFELVTSRQEPEGVVLLGLLPQLWRHAENVVVNENNCPFLYPVT